MLHSRAQPSLRLQAAYSNFCCIFIIPFINDAVDAADLNAPISWPEMDQQQQKVCILIHATIAEYCGILKVKSLDTNIFEFINVGLQHVQSHHPGNRI